MADELQTLIANDEIPNQPEVLQAIKADPTGTTLQKVKERHAALKQQAKPAPQSSVQDPMNPQWLQDIKSGKTKVDNGNGSYSTMRSVTYEEDGKTYLAPSIRYIDGKIVQMNKKQAIDYASKHRDGIPFNSQSEADAFDSNFHEKNYGPSPLNKWGNTQDQILQDLISQDKIPNNPQVIDAIKTGKVPLATVQQKHEQFRLSNPVMSVSGKGEINQPEQVKQVAVDPSTVQTSSQANFFNQGNQTFLDRLNPLKHGGSVLIPLPGGHALLPERLAATDDFLAKKFLQGASFGIYDPKIDAPTKTESVLGTLSNIAGGFASGGLIAKVLGKIPIFAKLGRSSAQSSETIKELRNAKIAAKGAGLTDELPIISKALFGARTAKYGKDALNIAGQSALTGLATGGIRSKLQGHENSEVFKDAVTESALFTAFGLALQPVAEGAGALFGRRQAGRQASVLRAVAGQPEVQALAERGITPEQVASFTKSSELGPPTESENLAAQAWQKIQNTKPLIGLKSSLLAHPELLKYSLEDQARTVSNALFTNGGPLESLVNANADLKSLLSLGKHAEALDSVQTALTDEIAKNPEAKEHILAPFAANSQILNKVYANRLMDTVNNPEKYPNLKAKVLNYLNQPTEENALLIQAKNAPKRFFSKVQKQAYVDPRLKPQEIDQIVGDLFGEAIDKIGKVSSDIVKPFAGRLNATDTILKKSIAFNRELNRTFIEAYAQNPQVFEENFVKQNPDLLEPTNHAINLKRIAMERNTTLMKRREISSAMADLTQQLQSATTDEAKSNISLQLQSLKDKNRVLTGVLSKQNSDIRELSTVLDSLAPEQKDQVSNFVNSIYTPRRSGLPFEQHLENRMVLQPAVNALKKSITKETTDTDRLDVMKQIRDLRNKYKPQIQSSQNYTGMFGKSDNPYYLKDDTELADIMNAFMATGKDISGDLKKVINWNFGINIENPRRQMNREFGPNNVFEKFFDKIRDRDSGIESVTRHYNDRIDALDIKAGSKESAMLQKFGEGRIDKTDPEFLALPASSQQKVLDAAPKARAIYDELIESLNRISRDNNLPEINKRSDFFHHFSETMNSLPNMISNFLRGDHEGIDFQGKGGRMYWKNKFISDSNRTLFGSERARTSDEFVDDAITGMKAYIRPAMDRIFYSDLVREVDTAKQFAPSNLGKFLDDIKDNYLLKLTNEVDKNTPTSIRKAINLFRNRMGRGAINYNVNVALQQLLSIPQNAAISPWHSTKALGQMFTPEGDRIAALSKNLATRDPTFLEVDKESKLFTNMVLDKLGISSGTADKFKMGAQQAADYWNHVGSYAMKTFDRLAAKHAFLTGYNKGISAGLNPDQAAQFGDKWAAMIQNENTRIAQPRFYQSTIGKALGQFSSFTTNYAASIMNDLPNIARTDGGAQAVHMIVNSVAGMELANAVAQSVGIPAPFDTQTFIPLLGGFRFGAPGPLGVMVNGYKAMGGDEQAKASLKKLPWNLVISGGGQLRKSIPAVAKAAEGGYPTPGKAAQNILFGEGRVKYEKGQMTKEKKSFLNKARSKVKSTIFHPPEEGK